MLNNILIRKYSKFIQKNWLALLIGAIASRLILAKVSTYAVYQLAWHVTGSVAGRYYIGSPYGYDLINWDASLKGITYGIYGFAFIIEVILVHIILKSNSVRFKSISPIASTVFLLSFPAFTSWPIEVPCERVDVFGFGCSRSIELVAPIILSNSPVYIIPSAVVALIFIKLYAKYFRHNLDYESNS